MDQFRIPCVIMRAGTSKGIFLKENDLPAPGPERDKVVLNIFGSPDKRQIDGLAGADPLTSKLAIIGPGSVPGADVDYTFAQVSITDAKVDWNGNCGNISSGVAPFAVDESIVRCHEGLNEVTIWQTNTQKMMKSYVLVENGKAKVTGDAEIAGVPGTAAPVQMDMSGTAGAATGKLLPTGNVVDVIETSRGPIEASIVDCANPVIFVRAESVGMKGTESQEEIDGNADLLKYLEEIRGIACVKCGMAKDLEDATKNSPAFPMVAFITEAQDYYYPPEDKTVKKEEVDLVSRLMFMQVLHKTYAGTEQIVHLGIMEIALGKRQQSDSDSLLPFEKTLYRLTEHLSVTHELCNCNKHRHYGDNSEQSVVCECCRSLLQFLQTCKKLHERP